jgi:hypothetical protein
MLAVSRRANLRNHHCSSASAKYKGQYVVFTRHNDKHT